MKKDTVKGIAVGVMAALLVAILIGAVVAISTTMLYYVWNWVMPEFGVREISWTLALGICLLLTFVKGIISVTVNKKD